jgi:histidyl-tRNA synthetase
LIAVDSEETRATAIEVAELLRSRRIPTEVAPRAEKFGRQIRYADRRGIPYVWFGGWVGGEVKDIRSGEQVAADPASWMPSPEDLRPRVLSLTPSC